MRSSCCHTVGMTDSGPLWLKVVLAAIPVLVAVIGGAFALINTVNRRIERLKNLVEIRKGFPDVLNKDFAVERLMLRELNTIERSTTPWAIYWRRRAYFAFALVYGVYAILIFGEEHLFARIFKRLYPNLENSPLWPAWIILAMVLVVNIDLHFVRKRDKAMKATHKARFELLDSLAALPERSDTESASTDADELREANEAGKDAPSDSPSQ
jgi:hypothetical protein